MDPNQNDQTIQTPQAPVNDNPVGQDPISTPQPEPVIPAVPEPMSTPQAEPTPAPVSDIGQAPMEEITPPPPMMEDHHSDEQPKAEINQGSTGDTNPVM
jgi:hypothetical protein